MRSVTFLAIIRHLDKLIDIFPVSHDKTIDDCSFVHQGCLFMMQEALNFGDLLKEGIRQCRGIVFNRITHIVVYFT